MSDQAKNPKDGIWIDESVRREIELLLKTSKRYIEMRSDNGGVHGDIGRINAILTAIAR